MDGGSDKNQTISDYAVFLRKLLPEIVGFRCIDRAGNLFWEEYDEPVEFSELYDACLQKNCLRKQFRHASTRAIPHLLQPMPPMTIAGIIVRRDFQFSSRVVQRLQRTSQFSTQFQFANQIQSD